MTVSSAGMTRWPYVFVLWGLLAGLTAVYADEPLDARQIVEEMVRRHEHYPYTFERQSMILVDKRGYRDVRKLRRFSRLEEDGTLKYLLVFDRPNEVRGVALLAIRHADGEIENGMYLPAFGAELKSGSGDSRSTPFLGTDFTVQDLTPEIIADFVYQREKDIKLDEVAYFVLTARPASPEVAHATGYSLRRLYVRQDNFFNVRTDYYDRRDRLFKRATYHDLVQVDGAMWRANAVLMENFREHHRSLIKIQQRVFSHDYVPAELFTREWILADRHIRTQGERLLGSPEYAANQDGDDPGHEQSIEIPQGDELE